MDSGREANPILITVMHSVIELHENVSEDMHFLQALLVDAQRLNDVATFASVGVYFVNLTGDPMVRRHVVFDSVDHIGQIGECELITLLA